MISYRPRRSSSIVVARSSSKYQVASFNIRNFFDAGNDPYYTDETAVAKLWSKLTRVSATIRTMDANVLALQKFESRGYLQRLMFVFLPDMSQEVLHYAGNDIRGRGLAMLSRVRVGKVTSHCHRRFPDDEGA